MSTSDPWETPTEEDILLDVERFLSRFVAYPSEATRVAHVLWIAHTHLMDQWESTPRIAFLSPEPGSGKSRALEVTELLVPRAEHAVNASPAALFRAVSAPEGPPTILFDEIDTVFGPKAKDNEDIRGMLNAGHRRGATALRCVMRGQSAELERFPAYCAVALAGLGDLPDTILSRSVVIKMRRRAPGERVEPFRPRLHRDEGHDLRERLLRWAERVQPGIDWPEMPDGVEDRAADVWEALLACADAAGGDWPRRASVAAVSLVTQASAGVQTLGVQLLRDIKKIFFSVEFSSGDHINTSALVDELVEVEESPWGDLRGKVLDARGLARRLKPYGIAPGVFRDGDTTHRGYARGDFLDAWARYAPAPPQDDVTSETAKQTCRGCGDPLDPVWAAAGNTVHPHPNCEVAA